MRTPEAAAGLAAFLEALGSDRPVPAGGSAAAATVAMAAGLVEKAARLSTTLWAGAGAARARAAALRRRTAKLIDVDSLAYTEFVEAVRAARQKPGRAAERVLRRARERTVDVPLVIVRAAAETVALAAQLVRHGNPNLASDALTAAHLAAAAAHSGVATIAANVPVRTVDVRLAEARRLARAASARVRLLPARGRAGDRRRGRGRSPGSAPR